MSGDGPWRQWPYIDNQWQAPTFCSCSLEVCRREGCIQRRPAYDIPPNALYPSFVPEPQPGSLAWFLLHGTTPQYAKPRVRVKAGREVVNREPAA